MDKLVEYGTQFQTCRTQLDIFADVQAFLADSALEGYWFEVGERHCIGNQSRKEEDDESMH